MNAVVENLAADAIEMPVPLIFTDSAAAKVAAPAAAATKLPQKAVHYQPQPKGKARCDTCLQWQAPKACKLVAGDIAPSGWCSLYAHKA